MKVYKYESENVIQWREDSPLPDGTPQSTLGIIVKGKMAKRPILTGTETVVVGEEPVLDAEGNPTYEQIPILDEEGNPVLDEEGNPTFEQGMPIMQDVTEERPIYITEEYSPWDELLSNPDIDIEPADIPPEPSYREKRAKRYAKEISPEQSVQTALGDCVDALILAVCDNDFTKINSIKAKIDKIKSEIPKR